MRNDKEIRDIGICPTCGATGSMNNAYQINSCQSCRDVIKRHTKGREEKSYTRAIIDVIEKGDK